MQQDLALSQARAGPSDGGPAPRTVPSLSPSYRALAVPLVPGHLATRPRAPPLARRRARPYGREAGTLRPPCRTPRRRPRSSSRWLPHSAPQRSPQA